MEPIPPMPNPAAHLIIGLMFILSFFWLLSMLWSKEWKEEKEGLYLGLGFVGIISLSTIVGFSLNLSIIAFQGLLITAILIFVCILIMIKISHYDTGANYYRGYFQYSKRMLKIRKLLPKIIIFLVVAWIAIVVLGVLKVM